MNTDTCIIVPAYNEAQVIREVLQKVLSTFSNVVCVDDGSTDTTSEEVLKTEAILVRHPINLGQGAALQTGVEYARQMPQASYFVTFDADGQHRLDDALAMIEELRRGNCNILLGSRFIKKGTNITGLKRIILKLAAIFTNLTTGTKLTDAHNGLRAFDQKFARKFNLKTSDMAHASEIIMLIKNSGLIYKEVPVTIDYTEYSRSKGQSLWNAINILFDIFMLRGRK